MRIFKTKAFARWSAKEKLHDGTLAAAIDEMERGLIDADLGGQIFKKRIRRPDAGKRGGYRTLLAYRFADRCFFVYGFAKNVRGNINDRELAALRRLAVELLGYDETTLNRAMTAGELIEVETNE